MAGREGWSSRRSARWATFIPTLPWPSACRRGATRPSSPPAAHYRARIEALGIGFSPVRPDLPDWNTDPELMRRILDARKGPATVVQGYVIPALRDPYEDTLAAAEGADLLVAHPLTLTTRLVAEKKAIPWASSLLAPLSFFSAHDPPVLPPARFLARAALPRPDRASAALSLHALDHSFVDRAVAPAAARFRLPPVKEDMLFEGQHSPLLVLALFLGPWARRAARLAAADRHHRLSLLRSGR